MLPRSLQIELCYDPAGVAHCCGGFADVRKGEYRGQVVAAKVPRIYATSDLQKIIRVRSRWRSGFLRICLYIDHNPAEVLQGVRNVENSSPSERVATTRSHNDWDPVCDGVRMDDEWKYQPICEGTQGRESI